MSRLSGKDKNSNVFNEHSKTKQKKCSVNSFTVDCKCFKHQSNINGQHRMKRLRSHKQRSQLRSRGREESKSEAHLHHQSSKNIAHFHTCCHRSCYCSSRRESPFPNIIPAAQETSIITDNRLIGHHCLFNHEVKSVDIERLLSKQRKQEKSEQQEPERNRVSSYPSSTSHNPSPLSSKELSGADINEVEQFEKKANPAKNQQDCCEKEKKNSQDSDITPDQRPHQEFNSFSGSCKSVFSSKHSSLDAVLLKSKKTNCGMFERGRGSTLVPTGDGDNVKTLKKKLKTNVTSTPEHTPKHRKPPIQQTQARGTSPRPLQHSSSPISQSFTVTPIRQDASCVSKSVSNIAAQLCDCLHLPILRIRNLVTQSREELLRVLQDSHGPQLQENLLKVKRSLSFGAGLTEAVTDEGLLFPAAAPAYQTDTAFQLCFGSQRTHKKTDGRFTDPMETSTNLLDGVLRPSCSATFCMDLEHSGASANDNLFSHSTTSCWAENNLASQHMEHSFNKSKSKESFSFDFFENNFRNHSGKFRESSGPQYSGSNNQPFSAYLAQLPDRHSAEPVHFPQEPDLFVTNRYANDQNFSAQIHQPHQSNNFQTFSQFTYSSTFPSLRPQNTDLMDYPPSHMLERDPAPPFSSLPSPEHWSFPPMRLY